MKKYCILTVIFAFALVSCEQPTVNDDLTKLPSLTITNESSFKLTNVRFSGVPFGDLPRNSDPVRRELTTDHIGITASITFTRDDIQIDCRVVEPIVITDDQDFFFLIYDDRPVEELVNSSNRKTLQDITFLSTVAVDYDNRTVGKGDVINLGESVVGDIIPNNFVLKNTGVGKMLLNVNSPVRIEGPENIFTVVQQPSSSTIASKSSLPFKINFNPKEEKTYSASVTIISNDQNGDYIFTIFATGVPPKPITSVLYGETQISQNGTIDVDEVIITQPKDITITIKNIGQLPLVLDTGNITITGSNAAEFIKLTNLGNTISTGSQTSFIIKCDPVIQGENHATLTIPTNDNNRNPIVVLLKMTAVKGSAIPELYQNSTIIPNNSLSPFDFGQVELGTNGTRAFSIKNTGNIVLELIGEPAIESSNPVFTVATQPTNKTINPNLTATFIIRYTPTDELENIGSIIITYNENAIFNLTVKGTGYVKRPQISVKQGNTAINQYGEYNFGRVAIGELKDISFVIENSGDANLTFVTVNNNRINLGDNGDEYFSIVQQPSSSTVVTPGSSTTFTVRFNSVTEGNGFTTTVLIETNSRIDNEFQFTVKTDSYEKKPQVTIKQGTTSIEQYGEYDFGTVWINTTKEITFTIENSGEANLIIEPVNDNKINLTDNASGFFSVNMQPLSPLVAPADSSTFTVKFTPTTSANNYNASVKVKTNSYTNDEFIFRVKGNGTNVYRIGDTGPGGGIIFYAQGNQYKECSAELGSYTWDAAKTAATAYRGGGFTNWRLPDRGELSLMHTNLRRNNLGGFNSDYYWSSEQYNTTSAWYQYFSIIGNQDYASKSTSFRVRAVRSFNF
jgi:hypothetical protein